MAEAKAIRHPGVGWGMLGITSVLTAAHLRAWPYAHPALDVVYVFWLFGAGAIFIGYRSFKANRPDLQPPTNPADLKKYHWLTVVALVGVLIMAALLASPYVIAVMGMPARMQAGAIGLSWTASMAVIAGLLRNRREWTALAVAQGR